MSDTILRRDSVLCSPPPSIEEAVLIHLDAITHTVKVIDLLLARLSESLHLHHDDLPERSKKGHEYMMADAWGLVDSFYRLSQLVAGAKGIKHNLPWFQVFLRKLKVVESIRHFLQHYEAEVRNLERTNKPVAGHLCWTRMNPSDDETVAVGCIVPGRIREGTVSILNPAGVRIHNEVDHITF